MSSNITFKIPLDWEFEDLDIASKWLTSNCKLNSYSWTSLNNYLYTEIHFKNEDEAMMFKLRFGV